MRAVIAGLMIGVCALVVAPAPAQAQDPGKTKETEKERKKREKAEFKKELKLREAKVRELIRKCESARPDQKWGLLGDIGQVPHPTSVKYLARMLRYQMQSAMMMGQVRMAAADAMKGQRDKKQPALASSATKILMAALKDRWNRREKEGDAVIRNSLKAIGDLRDPTSKKLLLKMIGNANTYWAEESVRALEKLRDASTIEKIINEWLRSENEGKKTSASDIDKERKQVLGEAAGSVLAALTGQQFDKPLSWQKWWSKNKRTFKIKPLPEEQPQGEGS